jgi:hypothetical protein
VIVVIASAIDDEARSLLDRWRSDIAVMTPLDMSSPGWRIEMDAPRSSFVAAGARHCSGEVDGVLTRLAAVPAAEMLVVAHGDREYAACEATATLAWWLATLRCPVINTPTPASLIGPTRHPTHWRRVAGELGVPTHGALCDPLAGADVESVTWCAVLDGQPLGDHCGQEQRWATDLAATSPCRLSAFAFAQPVSSLCATSQLAPLSDDLLDRFDELFS